MSELNARQPTFQEIGERIKSPLWNELCGYIEAAYGVQPSVEYSKCSGAPGWNVKYKKGGKALCTLYPGEGYFTALVAVGQKLAPAAEALLGSFDASVQKTYWNAGMLCGTRWLMIEVASPAVLRDVKQLLALRVPVKSGKKTQSPQQ